MSYSHKRIVGIDEIRGHKNNPKKWTAIIPAAGNGTRLGYDKPKILYPILGRPIVDWIIDSLDSVVSNFIFVLSNSGINQVEPYLKKKLPGRYTIVVQEEPTGMADAIYLTKEWVKTPYAIVMWGDQATFTAETIAACSYFHEKISNASLTLPTITIENPYIDIIRNESQRVIKVLQSREGEVDRAIGENDCGLFFFDCQCLFSTISEACKSRINLGSVTKELNLLPLIPIFENFHEGVKTVSLSDPTEALGINNEVEVMNVVKILKMRIDKNL
jgi:bifunctional UDP-N-acetylglucosamine pyrophosphorylase/glucosamine-1-phosphate N-acetyltransferase